MQFGIGDRTALLLHALGAERGIAAERLLVLLALANIRSRSRIRRRGLSPAICRGKHKRGSRNKRQASRHLLFLLLGRLRAPALSNAQSAIVTPPLTLRTWPVM